MPARDLDLIVAAAEAAGRIAMKYWKRGPQVFDKGAEGPVTEADLAVNRMLDADLRAARPDYGWLSEETPDGARRLEHERVFIIDPIDGTRAFIAGETAFAVAIAVATGGRVTAGVIHMPALGQTYAAAEGGPATRDGQPIHVSRCQGIPDARLLARKGALSPEHWPGGVPDLHRGFRASLAYRMALVAEGAVDGMLTIGPTWEWDVAAGALIAERAGAVVTSAAGGALTFNASHPRLPGVLAATPGLHTALLPRLQPAARAM